MYWRCVLYVKFLRYKAAGIFLGNVGERSYDIEQKLVLVCKRIQVINMRQYNLNLEQLCNRNSQSCHRHKEF